MWLISISMLTILFVPTDAKCVYLDPEPEQMSYFRLAGKYDAERCSKFAIESMMPKWHRAKIETKIACCVALVGFA